MGMWQLAAAANVLHRPICSVFPEKGWPLVQELNNRTLQPQTHSKSHHVTSCGVQPGKIQDRHWISNHFVPLLPLSDIDNRTATVESAVYNSIALDNVSLGDYFWATYRGTDVVGRVDKFILTEYCSSISWLKKRFFLFGL